MNICDRPTAEHLPIPTINRITDSGANTHDVVANRPQHGAEKGVVLHTIAASPPVRGDEFLEQGVGIEGDGMRG